MRAATNTCGRGAELITQRLKGSQYKRKPGTAVDDAEIVMKSESRTGHTVEIKLHLA